ncbi:hypothetical protein MHYP_G00051350 [Metynnis hypsauchen]
MKLAHLGRVSGSKTEVNRFVFHRIGSEESISEATELGKKLFSGKGGVNWSEGRVEVAAGNVTMSAAWE